MPRVTCRSLTLCVLATSLASVVLHAQSTEASISQLPIVDHPEAITGPWETTDGHGGAVGMFVTMLTQIEGAPRQLYGERQHEFATAFGLYHRTGPQIEQMGFSYFSDKPSGGALWNGQRLTIHHAAWAEIPQTEINLLFDEKAGTWSGRYQRGDFTQQVVLRRPQPRQGTRPSPFAGIWSKGQNGMNNCLHIAERQDGTLAAWTDSLQATGAYRYANGLKPPPSVTEYYATPARISLMDSTHVQLEIAAYSGICCSLFTTLEFIPDGRLRPTPPTPVSGIEAPHFMLGKEPWSRVSGISCVVPPVNAPLPASKKNW